MFLNWSLQKDHYFTSVRTISQRLLNSQKSIGEWGSLFPYAYVMNQQAIYTSRSDDDILLKVVSI